MTYHLQWTADNEEWTKDKLRWSSRSAVGETDMETQERLMP